MFDLEKAIRAWRRTYETSRAFFKEDLEELERHVRDHTAELVRRGNTPDEAFRLAIRSVGDFGTNEAEYRKLFWTKIQQRRAFWRQAITELTMFSNYFKVALRNLRRQPGYSFINIGGLGLGLACAFMIVLYVQHERSFDRFHEHGDRLFRLITVGTQGDNVGQKSALTPAGMAPELQARYPEIEALIRFDDRAPFLKVGAETRTADGFVFMDPAVITAFSFPLLQGDPRTALDAPNSLVLTRDAAESLLGTSDAVGKTVSYNGVFDMTVTGILAEVPRNSHIRFDYVAPFEAVKNLMGEDALTNFSNWNYFTYVLLKPGTDPAAFEAKLDGYVQERFSDGDGPASFRLDLQPIQDIHLTTDIAWDVSGNVDPKYIFMFSGIALLILLIACVNFMNLATARATKRAKEVGVRKVMGAQRWQLVWQFLGESVLLSVVSILIGLAGALLFLPIFRDIIGSEVSIASAGFGTLAFLIALGLFAGVVAGSYPAFYLAAYNPAAVLKGEATRSGRAVLLRRGLIVFQFAISIFLIVGTMTITKQLRYMKSQDLGFNKEHVAFAAMAGQIGERYDTFREILLQNPRVESVTRASGLPGRVATNRGYNWPGAPGEDEQGRGFYTIIADYDYVETLGLEMLAGRDFSREVAGDTMDAYILNETAVRALGLEPDEAVGRPFRAWDRPMGEIIGVVEDFHFQSLHQQIQPIVLNIIPAWQWAVMIRFTPGDLQPALAAVEEQWRAFAPGYPFSFTFIDQDFDRLYRADEDLGRLFTFFALIAVFVACLGLFGLASYSAAQRTKEIGVRKVLGASVPQVVTMLSKEFTRLVLIGFAVAAPIAYFAMRTWLEQFAYRTAPGVETFALAAILAFVIALCTVSYQSIKAAMSDPVKALRYE